MMRKMHMVAKDYSSEEEEEKEEKEEEEEQHVAVVKAKERPSKVQKTTGSFLDRKLSIDEQDACEARTAASNFASRATVKPAAFGGIQPKAAGLSGGREHSKFGKDGNQTGCLQTHLRNVCMATHNKGKSLSHFTLLSVGRVPLAPLVLR